ncbi:MAG: GtrA family protein [Clostridiales bacterium]|nr:GtrA family protein [Clostridiales bacterium]
MNIKNLFIGNTNNTFVQFFRYCFVGGLAFIADAGSLGLLVEVVKLDEIISAVIAFAIGLTVNYYLSKVWIFKKSKIENRFSEFMLFAIIGIVGLLMNMGIIWLFRDLVGPKQPLEFIPKDKYYMMGKLVSTVIVFMWNFFARKFLIFNKND